MDQRRGPDAVCGHRDVLRRSALRAALTLIAATTLLSCVPNSIIKRQREPAAAPATHEVAEARSLLKSSTLNPIRGAAPGEEQGTDAWRRRAVANALLTSYVRSREGPLYRKRDPDTGDDGLPRYCIALSGLTHCEVPCTGVDG